MAADVRSGALPCFVDEFAEAIGNGALTPSRWGELTLTELAGDDREQLEADLRYVRQESRRNEHFPSTRRATPTATLKRLPRRAERSAEHDGPATPLRGGQHGPRTPSISE
jgi:hypothetical protein